MWDSGWNSRHSFDILQMGMCHLHSIRKTLMDCSNASVIQLNENEGNMITITQNYCMEYLENQRLTLKIFNSNVPPRYGTLACIPCTVHCKMARRKKSGTWLWQRWSRFHIECNCWIHYCALALQYKSSAKSGKTM